MNKTNRWSFLKLGLCLALACLIVSVSRAAVPGDEHWDAQFGWPGPGGNNYAITMHNGRLYVGGLGASTNVALEVWDGVQWSAMSQFYGSGTTVIYDLAFVGDTLYAAGVFTNVDGVAASGLAKWDGTAWSSIGFKGGAYSLAVDGGNLYVGGGFTTNLSGMAMKNIARWDGANWYALGNGLGSTNASIVYTVTAANGIVYAGGYFTNSGSVLATNVARWDGANWSALGGGLNTIVSSLAWNGATLYAGGLFGSSTYSGVAKWDGTSWTLVGGGFDQGVQSLAFFNNLLCAAGTFTNVGVNASRFAVWNGSAWAAAGSGISSTGNRVYSTGTNVFVGGSFLLAGNRIANGLAAWDGVNWSGLASPGRNNGAYSIIRALASDGTNLYAAGGSLSYAGQTNVSMIARFDGANWYPLGSGITGPSTSPGPLSSTVLTLTVASNNVYAGGYFTSAGGVPVTNIAVWNGTSWSALGNPGGVVASILVRTNGVFAAGAPFYNASLYGAAFCERWDGSSWQGVINFPPFTDTAFYSADANIAMDALASIGTNIFIGGKFNIGEYANFPSGYTDCNDIMSFDGTYARVMGTGLSSNVTSMAVLGTNLYVAGLFTNAGGVAAARIAMWNGNYWTNVGSGLIGSGAINALTVMGGNLYAGGSFTNMGGAPVTRIARWDGTNWTALGNGLNYPGLSAVPVNALAAAGPDLYAGGYFRTAGDKTSFSLAHWSDRLNFNTPQLTNPAWMNSGQFHARLCGIAGLTNIIQATTNFTTWTPVLTNTAGMYDFTDPNSAAYRSRFYRALLGP